MGLRLRETGRTTSLVATNQIEDSGLARQVDAIVSWARELFDVCGDIEIDYDPEAGDDPRVVIVAPVRGEPAEIARIKRELSRKRSEAFRDEATRTVFLVDVR